MKVRPEQIIFLRFVLNNGASIAIETANQIKRSPTLQRAATSGISQAYWTNISLTNQLAVSQVKSWTVNWLNSPTANFKKSI